MAISAFESLHHKSKGRFPLGAVPSTSFPLFYSFAALSPRDSAPTLNLAHGGLGRLMLIQVCCGDKKKNGHDHEDEGIQERLGEKDGANVRAGASK